ncbi:MAG TPA: hypothetical protein VGZ00_12895 [Candidatus Baltobacteraceae bacterium]|jgi:hypothetical protein|nr:hypothetical protein [Candidatus Baltobacteraceae bacterium]
MAEPEDIEYTVYIPKYLDGYPWPKEGPGFLGDMAIRFSGKMFKLNIYDIVTLGKTCEGELDSSVCFTEPNLIVVKEITRENVFSAIDQIASAKFSSLLPEEYTDLPTPEKYLAQHRVFKTDKALTIQRADERLAKRKALREHAPEKQAEAQQSTAPMNDAERRQAAKAELVRQQRDNAAALAAENQQNLAKRQRRHQ